ncbi:MAG: SMP-30/gluconolactonase/LRE family protein, partial [Chitinophagaceae bacterium]
AARRSKLLAENASLQLISNNFAFTEGPAADKNGNVFFTDQPNNIIWKYDTAGRLSIFMQPAGRSNGMFFDGNGKLISCADEQNELWSISPQGKTRVLLNNIEGYRMNGPNDCWVDKKGGIYFTDPLYQRSWWTSKEPQHPQQQLYYLLPDNKLMVAATGFVKPNGLVGTANDKYLYVADIGADKTYRYRINPDGSLADKKLFVAKGSDGMTIDNKGNVYLTGKGVFVYSKKGKFLQHIEVPQPWTANVCFGGKDRNQLIITASTAVYTLLMKVRGVQ